MHEINKMDNFNVYLNRLKPYVTKGRNQTEEESVEFGHKILKILKKNNFLFTELDANSNASENIKDYFLGKNNFVMTT